MPLYDFRCDNGHRFERFIKLEDFGSLQNCPCGMPALRVISAPMFSVDQTGYNCPVTGAWIGSKREHEENLRRTDCRVLEAGEKEAAAAYREKADREFEKAVEATVEREVETMPSEKREKLYNELTRGGVNVEYQRGTTNAA